MPFYRRAPVLTGDDNLAGLGTTPLQSLAPQHGCCRSPLGAASIGLWAVFSAFMMWKARRLPGIALIALSLFIDFHRLPSLRFRTMPQDRPEPLGNAFALGVVFRGELRGDAPKAIAS